MKPYILDYPKMKQRSLIFSPSMEDITQVQVRNFGNFNDQV